MSRGLRPIFTTTTFFPCIDIPGAPEMAGYYSRDEERPGYRPARDTEALNASYERFLRTGVSKPVLNTYYIQFLKHIVS